MKKDFEKVVITVISLKEDIITTSNPDYVSTGEYDPNGRMDDLANS